MTENKTFFRPRLAFSRGADTDPKAAARAAEAERARQFRETILPHLDGAYNFARYLSRDATAAEDIVQEAFLRAFGAFGDFRGGAPKAWLFAIVRNCFLDWAAGRGGHDRVLVEEGALTEAQSDALANIADPDQDDPETALLRRREAQTVRAVVESLPEPFRETLILRELEELSYKEIAALTAAPIGTVMSRLARARLMLSDMLLPADAQKMRETQR
ncbi:sigma-70 family RNA polymerase sigma factor [Phenylobacterium sp.]|uniref:sigma-70 family RNA polymerase sigma factor n=1 Tax=Phenylobacterium sp. TaxID=1871053 RepID=UPI002CCF24D8|nr:sigma-70 family RNA polymerase sigma factor [Phenylobacterium sp.]HLZ74926.1 sigma-70 family RNA polymerase sigma factor [Phenylobacterium sp.]